MSFQKNSKHDLKNQNNFVGIANLKKLQIFNPRPSNITKITDLFDVLPCLARKYRSSKQKLVFSF